MKTATAALAFLLITGPAFAGASSGVHASIEIKSGSGTRVGARRNKADARVAITTRDGMVTMLLTGNAVAVQLTEKALHEVRHDKSDHEETGFAAILEDVLRSSIESVLSRTLEVSLSDIRTSSYKDGKLTLIGKDGNELFTNIHMNDQPLAESFNADDARMFVRELQRTR